MRLSKCLCSRAFQLFSVSPANLRFFHPRNLAGFEVINSIEYAAVVGLDNREQSAIQSIPTHELRHALSRPQPSCRGRPRRKRGCADNIHTLQKCIVEHCADRCRTPKMCTNARTETHTHTHMHTCQEAFRGCFPIEFADRLIRVGCRKRVLVGRRSAVKPSLPVENTHTHPWRFTIPSWYLCVVLIEKKHPPLRRHSSSRPTTSPNKAYWVQQCRRLRLSVTFVNNGSSLV